jgi:serine/threonine protein kinase
MGEVYRARHAELNTEHAIKIILPELADNQRIVDLFRREASILRTVRHDAVVAYDGIFRDENGRLYLVMEFVDGPSLNKYMRERRLDADEVRQLRDRLADGLAVAHEKGVIHRDLSPDNVILPHGNLAEAKIIDFGISKLADPGAKTIVGDDFAGKFSFVSPEQLGMFDGKVDARSDIYSLGLVLAAAAIGEPLDMGLSPISVIEARRGVPDLSRVPDSIRADLATMLEPDPADRPQSMRELTGRRDRRATDRRGAAEPTGGRRKDQARSSRIGVGAIAGIAAALIVVAGGAWYVIQPMGGTGNGPPREEIASSDGSSAVSPTPVPTPTPAPMPTPITAVPMPAPTPVTVVPTPTLTPAPATPTIVPAPASTTPDAGEPSVSTPNTASGPTDTTDGPSGAANQSAADPQVALLPVVPDPARIRRDAQKAIANLSCSGIRIEVSGSGDVAASGYVASNADRNKVTEQLGRVPDVGRIENAVTVMQRPLCQILDVLATATAFSFGPGNALAIDPGGAAGVYRRGDHINVTVTAPPTDGFLYVDYVDAAEKYVIHLLPNDRFRPENRIRARERVVIGSTPQESSTYVIQPPYGTNLIIAVVSRQPLFDRMRPIQEGAEAYLEALRNSLEKARTQGGPQSVVSTYVSVVLRE